MENGIEQSNRFVPAEKEKEYTEREKLCDLLSSSGLGRPDNETCSYWNIFIFCFGGLIARAARLKNVFVYAHDS